MFCDRVPSAEGVQAEHPSDARAGRRGRSADGNVGRRRSLRARRAVLESGARARQLYTYCFSYNKVRPNWKARHVVLMEINLNK